MLASCRMVSSPLFGTDGVRGTVGDDRINPQAICHLGWAIGCVFRDLHGPQSRILVGKDTRVSGYMLESALEAGLSAAGVHCQLLGPMPTPAVSYLTRTLRAAAGLVISASHNPYADNGVKCFNHAGDKLSKELEARITELTQIPLKTVACHELGKASRLVDARGRYIEFCKSKLPGQVSLKGLRLVVDCANGATYHIAPQVLQELGAEVISLHCEPDGFNINAQCGSTHPNSLQAAVLAHQAHAGIAWDGDGDRCVMVDEQGRLLDGDDMLWVITRFRHHQTPIPGVVGTVMSNGGLEQALAALNIPMVRSDVGDKHVMQALRDRDWPLGSEPSGHLIDRPRMISGDGMIAALSVLEALYHSQQPLSQHKDGWKRIQRHQENIPLSSQTRAQLSAQPEWIQNLTEAIPCQPGQRVVIRPSGTEPVLRVLLEGEDAHWRQQALKIIQEGLRKTC